MPNTGAGGSAAANIYGPLALIALLLMVGTGLNVGYSRRRQRG
jgi:hypothetical protein